MAEGDERGTVETVRMPNDERREVLNRELQKYGAMGWRIETRSDFQATIAKGRQISHACTCS